MPSFLYAHFNCIRETFRIPHNLFDSIYKTDFSIISVFSDCYTFSVMVKVKNIISLGILEEVENECYFFK